MGAGESRASAYMHLSSTPRTEKHLIMWAACTGPVLPQPRPDGPLPRAEQVADLRQQRPHGHLERHVCTEPGVPEQARPGAVLRGRHRRAEGERMVRVVRPTAGKRLRRQGGDSHVATAPLHREPHRAQNAGPEGRRRYVDL